MSVLTSTSHTPAYPTEPVFRLTVEQYHAMIRSGVLDEDDPVELVEGVLLFKMPKNKAHTIAMSKIITWVVQSISRDWTVRAQDPITLVDGEPEPDLVVATATSASSLGEHPGGRDVALVIEIADTSLARDRGTKLRSYARGGIATYWIINLAERCIEQYAEPDATAGDPTYRSKTVLTAEQDVQLPATLGGARVAVRMLLPA